MAESFLYNIGESVLGKLASLALENFFLAWELQSDVEKIKKSMVAINAVLLDAEQRQSQNHAIVVWLRELKDVFYDIDDVVDEFECEALERQVVESGTTARKVRRFCSKSNPFVFRFRMAHILKNMRKRVSEIASLKSSLGLTEGSNNMPNVIRGVRLTHSFVRKEDVIGREDDKINIINMLLLPIDGENVSVIPIVGIGGLGKTTLAKLVYNDESVASHFEKKMWVCVSEEFELRKVVIQILQSLDDENRTYVDMHIEQLQRILRETLDGNRYLLVMDDVWNEDSRKWLELKELLLDGTSGSRIIITTQSNRVASIMGTVPAYNLEDLSHDHCFSLFFKYAFKQVKDKQDPELIRIGEEIVRKCKGVPLALVTLATLLHSTDKREWESVRDSELWRLEQRENDILPALKLSYKHLPPHLKRCFAYCSIFPKDCSFKPFDLVHYWIANGLIQPSSANQELERIGSGYFKELSFRCFFQDFTDHNFVTTCKMHDLIHDLAVSVAQNEISTVISCDQEISESVRHLSFPHPESLTSFLESPKGLYHVRTIFFTNSSLTGFTMKRFFETCLSRCHYLRYLDLSFSASEKLPDSIGDLKHLRYLSLWSCHHLKRLPNSICKLQNLQTLNLGQCSQLEELPRDIKDLISLRCLIITTTEKRLAKSRIGSLKSLRCLWIFACHKLEYLFEDMEDLQSLRFLSIFHCDELICLPNSVRKLTSLDTLSFTWCGNLDLKMEESENDQCATQFSLQKLNMYGLLKVKEFPEWLLRGSVNSFEMLNIAECSNLRQVPEWVKNIPTLQKLSIHGCPLIEDSGKNIIYSYSL
ncbi:Disease resistance protein RGA2 [Euphorbia peplus]|nr:Disease resistance protein RGA2 [Euphorbia peplus]